MYKLAFVFPGQGAQYIGMAKDFYETIPECKEVFDTASKVLNFNMAKLCFEENNLLNQTEYTQVAMLTSCICMLTAINKLGVHHDISAGLSLGEYTALVANGFLSFEEALLLVKKRGAYMANEVPNGEGAMAAIIGLSNEIVESTCKEVSQQTSSVVEPANYNCPGQIVISGKKHAVEVACQSLKEKKARRTLFLNVSGPFHSQLLLGAGKKLKEELKNIKLKKGKVPYVCNVEAEIINSDANIKNLLEKQVYSSVKWQQSVEKMIQSGVETFVEIGPGKTLSNFIKKVDRTKNIINIEKVEDLQKLNAYTTVAI